MPAAQAQDKTYSTDEIAQLLAHYILAKKAITQQTFDDVLDKYISKIRVQDKGVRKELIQIKTNEILQEIGFQAQQVTTFNHQKFYVCYSTMDDSLTKQNNWQPKESRFFWQVVKKLFEKLNSSQHEFEPNDESSIMEIFSMSKEDCEFFKDKEVSKDLTQLAMESLIQKFVEEEYLLEINRGGKRIMLGPRTLAEMKSLLVEKFALEECRSCKVICFVGYRCEPCDRIYHDECLANPMKCNECKRNMPEIKLFI